MTLGIVEPCGPFAGSPHDRLHLLVRHGLDRRPLLIIQADLGQVVTETLQVADAAQTLEAVDDHFRQRNLAACISKYL